MALHPSVAEPAVIGTGDKLTGQAVHAFITPKPEFQYDKNDESAVYEL